jgi:hypothetical protein
MGREILDGLDGWALHRITYTVRGRDGSHTVERFAATRRAAERAAVPVLAASWQVRADDITVTRVDRVIADAAGWAA